MLKYTEDHEWLQADGDEVIVGVNKYRKDKEDPIDILEIDNQKVREGQIARLEKMRASRDEAACQAALAEVTRRAAEGGNLLEAAVDAARARASVGEISMAMEKQFGRHRAEVKTLAGVYGAAYEGDEGFAAIQRSVEQFAEDEGRRPRMLVVKMGQDGHDRGAKVIATAFADIGFDVDVGPLFQTPAEAAQDAVMDIYETLTEKLRSQEVTYFKSWLYMVSKNHCLMVLRKQDRNISLDNFVHRIFFFWIK